MAQITYADKSAINVNSSVPNVNKVNASDMNEIKSVVNNNYTELVNTINAVNEKSFICCGLSASQSISTTAEQKVKLNNIIASRGTDFTFSTTNNNVTCNFDGYIEASGQVQFGNANNTSTKNVYIKQNGVVVTRSLSASYTNSGNKVGWITPIIISVSNGDKITLECYASSGESINHTVNSTNMTIKRL